MYDFCFTYPYALLLGLGGIIGFLTKGSVPSLVGGVGSAGALAVCAQISLNAYHRAELNKYATAASMAIAAMLTVVMGLRWRRTGKFMPPGIVCLLSAAMVVFYIWNLQHFKSPLQIHKPDAVKR